MLHIDPIIPIWIGVALNGAVFGLIGAANASASYAIRVKEGTTGAALISAQAIKRDAIGLALVNIVFAAIGAIALVAENLPPSSLLPAMRQGTLIDIALLLALSILSVLSVLRWVERYQVLASIEREDSAAEAAKELAALTAKTHAEQMAALQSIHEDIAANTELTSTAAETATKAYSAANEINMKITTIATDRSADSRTRLTDIQKTTEDTNRLVRDSSAAATTAANVAANETASRLADIQQTGQDTNVTAHEVHDAVVKDGQDQAVTQP